MFRGIIFKMKSVSLFHRQFFAVLLAGVGLCGDLKSMPSDYLSEANDLASAEELNLLYSSIPHRRGVDKFKIHSSYRKNNTTKYYILSKRHVEVPQKTVFLIASTSSQGGFVHSESEEIPFEGGLTPAIQLTMPVEDLYNLYKISQDAREGGTFDGGVADEGGGSQNAEVVDVKAIIEQIALTPESHPSLEEAGR